MMDLWKTFAKAVGRADAAHGKKLAAHFREHGHIGMTPSAAVRLADGAIAAFYAGLSGSPATESSHEWMLASDFAFVNVRACSPDPTRTGTVVDALKLIPTMRVNAIHLAPFFDCSSNNLYAVDSVRIVCDDVLDPRLTAAGLDRDDQVRLLVDGIHRLGWRVGFDLEPHTSNFSRLVLAHPRCFRWLRYNQARDGLFEGVTQDEMLDEAWQERLSGEVSTLVATALASHGLTAVEDLAAGVERVRACHQEIIRQLIDGGWWTLPSHAWGGVGVPKFDHYVHDQGYPDYEYLNADGEDQHEHSFGMLSPFAFYEGLPLNRVPSGEAARPHRNHEAIGLFEGVFPEQRKRYGFDFVRLDYVDHVFDSIAEDDPDYPISDRATPALLKGMLAAARAQDPHVGAMAERMMGCDVEEYGALGFNLLLGPDVLSTMHPEYVRFLLELQKKYDDPALGEKHCATLAVVDTHDSGHPLFWSKPMSEALGPASMRLRHFMARFTTCGMRRRPKYEVMGNQDLSHGLYEANNQPISLTWVDDASFNERYHALEDAWTALRPELDASRMGPFHASVDESWAAWFLDGQDRLLCVAALEPEPNPGQIGLSQWAAQPKEARAAGPIHIDVCLEREMADPVVTLVPLDPTAVSEVALDGRMLRIDRLAPREYRVYRIHDRT